MKELKEPEIIVPDAKPKIKADQGKPKVRAEELPNQITRTELSEFRKEEIKHEYSASELEPEEIKIRMDKTNDLFDNTSSGSFSRDGDHTYGKKDGTRIQSKKTQDT